MTVDELNAMELDDLAGLIKLARGTYERRRIERFAALKREFEAQLRSEGFTLDELLAKCAKRSSKAKRRTMPSKYAHPDKPELTWSGLGRKPSWLRDFINEGNSLDDARMSGHIQSLQDSTGRA